VLELQKEKVELQKEKVELRKEKVELQKQKTALLEQKLQQQKKILMKDGKRLSWFENKRFYGFVFLVAIWIGAVILFAIYFNQEPGERNSKLSELSTLVIVFIPIDLLLLLVEK